MSLRQEAAMEEVVAAAPVALKAHRLQDRRARRYRVLLPAALPPEAAMEEVVAVAPLVLKAHRPQDRRARRYRVLLPAALPPEPVAVAVDAAVEPASALPRSRRSW
jgi:hypothetical protein